MFALFANPCHNLLPPASGLEGLATSGMLSGLCSKMFSVRTMTLPGRVPICDVDGGCGTKWLLLYHGPLPPHCRSIEGCYGQALIAGLLAPKRILQKVCDCRPGILSGSRLIPLQSWNGNWNGPTLPCLIIHVQGCADHNDATDCDAVLRPACVTHRIPSAGKVLVVETEAP